MRVYIASSWKNQHGVELLTRELRREGCTVISWIENSERNGWTERSRKIGADAWLKSFEADEAFKFDTNGATTCDLFIYYAPAGSDAAAELGAAWAKDIPTLGLAAKGDSLGICARMVNEWYYRYTDLLTAVIRRKRALTQ